MEAKVLFLDLDGVLVSDDNEFALLALWHTDKKQFKSRDEFGLLFDERCVRWLHWIVLKTNCKIVLSSDRRSRGLNAIQLMWEVRDLPSEVIDITPTEVDSEIINLYASTNNEADRGYEIQQWIDEHKPKRYCIIDDHDDMLSHQLKYFVKTNKKIGLNQETAKMVVAILNGNS